jgi:hypothetical protein
MERFPGQMVMAGAIMLAGAAVNHSDIAWIAAGVGLVITVMGMVIGYFALKGAAEARGN